MIPGALVTAAAAMLVSACAIQGRPISLIERGDLCFAVEWEHRSTRDLQPDTLVMTSSADKLVASELGATRIIVLRAPPYVVQVFDANGRPRGDSVRVSWGTWFMQADLSALVERGTIRGSARFFSDDHRGPLQVIGMSGRQVDCPVGGTFE